MHQFYCPNTDLSSKQTFIDDKNELHHLRNVLRLKKDDEVRLFDGKGKEASGTLLTVTAQKATVEIHSVKQFERKKPLILLACALPKKSKFEMIIEKATELGVDEIIPLKTDRTEIKLTDFRQTKKQQRYQTIAINASKQSKRIIIPVIHPITDFSSALNHLTKTSITIIPSLNEDTENLISAFEKIKSPKAVSFLIGPEGDFSPEEYAQAQDKGCLPVTLGTTILKVETAALCALSCANLFFHA